MSAYAVDKVCYRVAHDREFRAQLLADPEAALRDARPALEEEEVRLLLAGDVGALSVRGSHDFLLYQLQRLEVLGVTVDSYNRSIKEAHDGSH